MSVHDFTRTKMANGSIPPSVAVMNDVSADFKVIVATAGAKCIGISQKGERRDPSNSDGYAAIAGESIMIYGEGAKDVMAKLGSGGATVGDRLKAATGGLLVVASADGDEYVAIANQTGVASDLISVDVVLGMRGA